MTDTAAITPPPEVNASELRAEEDKVLPAVVYGLYLLGFTNGLTFVIGLIVAYLNRDQAGPINQSHYTFAIRTFWLAIAWFLIGCALLGFGFLFTLTLVGIVIGAPMMIIGGVILGAGGIWFTVRCIMGIVYLVRGEAYPRPLAWLI